MGIAMGAGRGPDANVAKGGNPLPGALNRLSTRRIQTVKPTGRITRGPNKGKRRTAILLCDGGGLYVQATIGDDGNVRRSWIFRYQLSKDHPVRDMGLGPVVDVHPAEARELARKYRGLMREGKDPVRERDAERARNLAASTAVMTFDQAAEIYIAQHRSSWKNPAHAAQWPATLQQYVSPVIGKMAVNDIDTPHVLKVLTPIWTEMPVSAKKIRGRIENILGWATVAGYRKDANGHDKPNPARWRGHLQTSLAAPGKVRAVRHQPSLPYAEAPAFMAALRKRQGMAALALEFTILTCVRVSDVLHAKHAHINRVERRWDIPHLSKTGVPHRVPLSDAALAVLDKAKNIAGDIGGAVAASEYLFPNDITGAALHRNALLALLDRMGHKGEVSTHGFRAGFRTWAQERSNFPWELCELALGHKVGDAVERAYARGDALRKRVAIMQQWARFLARPPKAGVKADEVVVDFARASA
jgi:integrase